MFNIMVWKDHTVSPGNTYKVKENSDGTITLTPAGTVIQQGTNMSSVNFNNMETGIFAANITALEAVRVANLLSSKVESLEGTVITFDLANTKTYPFNNSVQTVAFPSELVRHTKDYTVTFEVVESSGGDGGAVKEIVITDKLLNGFKVAYTGSAAKAKIKCYVQGGRY